MPTFMISMNWTDQGIRTIKDAQKRLNAARDLAKKVGVEIKQVWLTNGETDLVSFVEAANGDNVAKFVLALGSYGNVHTRSNRARSEQEYLKLVSELPRTASVGAIMIDRRSCRRSINRSAACSFALAPERWLANAARRLESEAKRKRLPHVKNDAF